MDEQFHDPYFLGPYGENDEVFERILVEFLRDHVYWRRNFHPEDPPPISTMAAQGPEYGNAIANMKRELHRLSAALKRSIPFSSPRYMGHMVSDPIMPGLLAQMITLPYNPNNVVHDSAPVTVDMEVEAGLMLARMLGYPDDENESPCAFGHLTSGGTLANYEGLALHRALRFYPVAAAAGCRTFEVEPPPMAGLEKPLTAMDDWALANLHLDTILELRSSLPQWANESLGSRQAEALMQAVERERVESLGHATFARRHPDLGDPCVIIPYTAHYSWGKAMKLLGLGSQNLVHVGEHGMRMDPEALNDALSTAEAARRPVLLVAGILGTTEFGTIDPVHDIVAARKEWQARGLGFGVHVDAAWGGYLASIFRAPDGSILAREKLRETFRYFPSEHVYNAFAALAETDSVTVDPHKLGYFPFGAGAFVCRDSEMMDFMTQNADYIFDARTRPDEGYRGKFRSLGRYILEGSKPGAAAAAVCVTHRVLPLHCDGFGRLSHCTIENCEYFFDRIRETGRELASHARLVVPVEPDTNLICLAINPEGNTSLAEANRFTRRLFEHLKVDASQPVQVKQFFGSYTSLDPDALGPDETARILSDLGLDPSALTQGGEDVDRKIFILRHTLMNPWLIDTVNSINYMDAYCDYLRDLVLQELGTST